MPKKTPKIKIVKDGPYMVSGNVPITKQTIIVDEEGISVRWQEGEKYPEKKECGLCRCGQSKAKPYCDGTHSKVDFDGTETASRKKYLEQAEKIDGPDLDLTDAPDLCASARFCDRAGGTWNLTRESGNPESRKMAIEEACDCPSGRLVAWDKKIRFDSESRQAGQTIEPEFAPSIGLVEDPVAGASGPLWVKGGIPIESADGKKYEERNRATLCRCGKSKNKPFCDGTHISIGFSA